MAWAWALLRAPPGPLKGLGLGSKGPEGYGAPFSKFGPLSYFKVAIQLHMATSIFYPGVGRPSAEQNLTVGSVKLMIRRVRGLGFGTPNLDLGTDPKPRLGDPSSVAWLKC